MAYPPKIVQALKLLEAAGVPKRQAEPWSYRLLWRLGIPVRPAQFETPFISFIKLFTILPVFYLASYLLAHWLISGSDEIRPSSLIGGGIGAFVGTGIAFAVRNAGTRKYNLPPWSEIDDIASRFD
jgi:hypothetical protein